MDKSDRIMIFSAAGIALVAIVVMLFQGPLELGKSSDDAIAGEAFRAGSARGASTRIAVARCGDGVCQDSESFRSCSQDCSLARARINPDSNSEEPTAVEDPTANDDDDNDGLTNAQEEALGTNKEVADTDGDGLTDGDEMNSYGTNPLLVDTDSDGFSDYNELNEESTNPLDQEDHLGLIITVENNYIIRAYREDDNSLYWSRAMTALPTVEDLLVAKGYVVFANDDAGLSGNRCVYALNVQDASLAWTNCDSTQHGPLAYLSSTGYVYEGVGTAIKAYDIETGDLVNSITAGRFVQPNTYHKTFFASEDTGYLYAYIEDGSSRQMLIYNDQLSNVFATSSYRIDATAVGDMYAGSNLYGAEGNTWTTVSNNYVFARKDVADACTRSENQGMYAKAVLEHDGMVYVGFDGTAYCNAYVQAYDVNSLTAAPVWEVELESLDGVQFSEVGDAFATDGNYLYLEGSLMALDLNDGSLAWYGSEYEGTIEGNIQFYEGSQASVYQIVQSGTRNVLMRLDAQTGSILNRWTSSTQDFVVY